MMACLLAGVATCTRPIRGTGFLCEFAAGPRYTDEARSVARQRISVILGSYGLTPKFQEFGSVASRRSGMNVYAELPASVPSIDWIVVGAHYDTVSRAPGADDDGSGVMAVLIAARELTKLPYRRANVIFAFFDLEEAGLLGSDVFAESLRIQGCKIIAVHCIDMIGVNSDASRTVVLAHGPHPVPGTGDSFVDLYRRAANRLGLTMPIRRTEMDRSDHVSFTARGFPAVLVTEITNERVPSPYYHSPSDACDTINYDYLRAVAAMVTAAVTEQIK